MKKMNFIILSILVIGVFALVNISIANAAEGYNLLFDANRHNSGKPLNYSNTGCLIYNASEQMSRYSMTSESFGSGVFYATGSEKACASVCASWKSSFTNDPGPYYWETNFMYVYPNGYPVDYYIPGANYVAHYVCKVNYSPKYSGDDNCFQSPLDPPNPKVPYAPIDWLFLEHTSDYAYCSLKGSM